MQSYTLAVVGAFSVIDRIDVDGGVDVDEGGEDEQEHHLPELLISGDGDSQLLNTRTRRRLPRQCPVPVTSRAVNEVSRKFYNIHFFTVWHSVFKDFWVWKHCYVLSGCREAPSMCFLQILWMVTWNLVDGSRAQVWCPGARATPRPTCSRSTGSWSPAAPSPGPGHRLSTLSH